MAQQIGGLCTLEGTFDQLTFYKMDGKHYVRTKSSLTSKRVKTSPEFRSTMACASLLSRASKIGSAINKALPENWRQFWMYRSFTGEAFTLLKENAYTDEEVKQMLWKTYVEYWEKWEAASTDKQTIETIKTPKPKQIRKQRKYTTESMLRKKDRYGKPMWRDLEEEERKRVSLERKKAWAAAIHTKRDFEPCIVLYFSACSAPLRGPTFSSAQRSIPCKSVLSVRNLTSPRRGISCTFNVQKHPLNPLNPANPGSSITK